MPVLHGSIEAGTFEAAFFAPPAKGKTDQLLRMAREPAILILSATKRSLAELTTGAMWVYEELLTFARLNASRVYPSYGHLVRTIELGHATVARVLHLFDAGGPQAPVPVPAYRRGGDGPALRRRSHDGKIGGKRIVYDRW